MRGGDHKNTVPHYYKNIKGCVKSLFLNNYVGTCIQHLHTQRDAQQFTEKLPCCLIKNESVVNTAGGRVLQTLQAIPENSKDYSSDTYTD